MRTGRWPNWLRCAVALGLAAMGLVLGANGLFGLIVVAGDLFERVQQVLIGAIFTTLGALSIVIAALLVRPRSGQSRDIAER